MQPFSAPFAGLFIFSLKTRRKEKKTSPNWTCLFGADDEARTRYLHLGKVALYQMSYTRVFFCDALLSTGVIISKGNPFVNKKFSIF
jgi:hypothetical protein